jgi:hypothetical protein
MSPYIVCCGTNGRAVIYGRSESPPVAGQPFGLEGARMVLYWSQECGGLLGLAAKGPKTSTRITHAIPYHSDECARQVLGVTDEAAEAIDKWPAAGDP